MYPHGLFSLSSCVLGSWQTSREAQREHSGSSTTCGRSRSAADRLTFLLRCGQRGVQVASGAASANRPRNVIARIVFFMGLPRSNSGARPALRRKAQGTLEVAAGAAALIAEVSEGASGAPRPPLRPSQQRSVTAARMLVRGTRSIASRGWADSIPNSGRTKDSRLLGVRALRDRMVFWLPRLSARPTPAGDQSRRLACLLLAVGQGRHAVSARKERGDRHGLCPRPARPPVLGPGTTSSARAPLPGATPRTRLASARSHGLRGSRAGAQGAPGLCHAPSSALRPPTAAERTPVHYSGDRGADPR